MAKSVAEIQSLADKLVELPTADKFTMASMLVMSGKLDVAETVAKAALDDLQARRLLNISRAPLTRRK